jgi:hypothetical protein
MLVNLESEKAKRVSKVINSEVIKELRSQQESYSCPFTEAFTLVIATFIGPRRDALR